LAVPGANLKDVSSTADSSSNPNFKAALLGPLYGVSLKGYKTGTELAQTVRLDPGIVILWIGNNDILGAATKANPKKMTKTADFKKRFADLFQKLKSLGADVVTATIPDVTLIPHMLRVGEKIGDLPFRVVKLCGDITSNIEESIVPRGIQRGRGEHPIGSLVPFLNLNTKLEGLELCFFGPFEGNENTFSKNEVLDPNEIQSVKLRTAELNAAIFETAALHDSPVIDINELLRNRDLSFAGGLFSLDGIHPSSEGHRIIANVFIDAINRKIEERGSFGGQEIFIEPLPEPAEGLIFRELQKEKRPKVNLEALGRSLRRLSE